MVFMPKANGQNREVSLILKRQFSIDANYILTVKASTRAGSGSKRYKVSPGGKWISL